MSRPIIAQIDISAMQHNCQVARFRVPTAKVWAVVKANAYGHGLLHGMEGFAAADGLALVELEGALRLRQAGWIKPILLLEGFFSIEELSEVKKHGLDTVVHCEEQVKMLESLKCGNEKITVHLKINTGMNRLGFVPLVVPLIYQRLKELSFVGKIILLTHFANADTLRPLLLPVTDQLQNFEMATIGLKEEVSLSNSGAILLYPHLKTDWIRPGIMLYGASPGEKTAVEFGLRPVMTLRSEIIAIQVVKKGQAVGYGSAFVAQSEMLIGVVACGYADGYPRHAPLGTPVLVEGVKTRLIGRVSMDMITVDLTPIPKACIGSKVVLWGEGLDIDEVARSAGTIGYELMCAVSQRVPLVKRV